ncbi:MAG: methylmalonyl Co-A mutase-associated GTPase MeaB [Alphaproteobacteria bacterium GM202ARS2]|nr:methylmalonyl Co-A mutase-associated GTPase MeaB [Alphaproteobacteria bacterium GM202ARS2]
MMPPSTASIESLADELRRGNRRALAQAITLVESTHPEHRVRAQSLIQHLLPASGASLRIGISGPPGAGKSTFLDAFGSYLADKNHKVAVLAIDPSSVQRQQGSGSGGAILGDKTRMSTLALHKNAFIRPSPSRGMLGGTAPKTYETIILCEAAGYDTLFIETVGVGQSEVNVANLTDMLILILPPASGDSLQGIKRGIMEVADLILINKADGNTEKMARLSAQNYHAAVRLLPQKRDSWHTSVIAISALAKKGLDETEHVLKQFKQDAQTSGYLANERNKQAQNAFWQSLHQTLYEHLHTEPKLKKIIQQLYKRIEQKQATPQQAANDAILALYAQHNKG